MQLTTVKHILSPFALREVIQQSQHGTWQAQGLFVLQIAGGNGLIGEGRHAVGMTGQGLHQSFCIGEITGQDDGVKHW